MWPGLQVIDHLILSDPHKGHLELLADVFDRVNVKHVWDSDAVNKTCGYCRFFVEGGGRRRIFDTSSNSGLPREKLTGASAEETELVCCSQ